MNAINEIDSQRGLDASQRELDASQNRDGLNQWPKIDISDLNENDQLSIHSLSEDNNSIFKNKVNLR